MPLVAGGEQTVPNSTIRVTGSFELTDPHAHVISQAQATAYILKLCLKNTMGEMVIKSLSRPEGRTCLMKLVGLLCSRTREWSGPQEAQCSPVSGLPGYDREFHTSLWTKSHTEQARPVGYLQNPMLGSLSWCPSPIIWPCWE